jgi:hypothetical protein
MECQSIRSPGGAPAGVSAAVISAFLPESVGRGFLVTKDQREVCPLSREVMLPGGATPVRPVTGRHSLAPSSSTCNPASGSCESPSLSGRLQAYHVPYRLSEWGGLCLFAGGATSAAGDKPTPAPGHLPFGSGLASRTIRGCARLLSIFGLSLITTFSSTSLTLTRPLAPGPRTA